MNSKLLAFLTALLYFTGPWSRAEYRAYELKVENIEQGTERTVMSTLDHLQYPKYYPLGKDEIISYVDSWMCFENMSEFKSACLKPNSEP